MFLDSLDQAADGVLNRFSPAACERTSLGNAGGFSGARLWRVSTWAGDWCLKAWPAHSMTPHRIGQIHVWMSLARTAGLNFVPAVWRDGNGATWHEWADRLWDMTQWMPGAPEDPANPTRERVTAAMTALARLHRAWSQAQSQHGPCHAIQRRLNTLHEWQAIRQTGWQPDFGADDDPVRPLAIQAWQMLPARLAELPKLLHPLRDVPMRLHPCLGDIWRDHVLFDGDTVTAIIDYGAMRIDTPTVDLARLLGSLTDHVESFRAGIEMYRNCAPLSPAEMRLVSVLDISGTLLGLANWLRRLYFDRREYPDRLAVAGRLQSLLNRLTQFG